MGDKFRRGLLRAAGVTGDRSWVAISRRRVVVGLSAVLTSIDVGYNKIGKEQALSLVSIFKKKDQMKSVGLAAYCDLGVDGAKACQRQRGADRVLATQEQSRR